MQMSLTAQGGPNLSAMYTKNCGQSCAFSHPYSSLKKCYTSGPVKSKAVTEEIEEVKKNVPRIQDSEYNVTLEDELVL